MPPRLVLSDSALAGLDARLADSDARLVAAYPGEDGRRQPVHTVYVPADRYDPELPQRWGAQARELVAAHGGMEKLCLTAGLAPELAAEVAPRVVAKLEWEPIEDLRLDFEDGYGTRPDDEEDRDAVAAATRLAQAVAAGAAPPFVGLRFKCFEAASRRRGARTLDLFLGALLERTGTLPAGLIITFPKVSTVSQVEALVDVCEQLETGHALAPGRLGFEIQVETPQLIIGADGRIPVAAAIAAASGRVTALHYGTYDYSASLQISAAYQASDHPAADFAKQVMQVATAGTGVTLSDGSTNVLPIGTADEVRAAWRLHAGLVRRALERGFYQGWDMHPGQLPTRYAATFGFYREGAGRAGTRLRNYFSRADSAVLDEPATARALARYLQRGYSCGALGADELLEWSGSSPEQLAALALPHSDAQAPALATTS